VKDEAFAKLVESIQQAGEIKRGVRKPSRIFEFSPLDVKVIRKQLHKSQREFTHDHIELLRGRWDEHCGSRFN
jgi:putative transcriptional regulator